MMIFLAFLVGLVAGYKIAEYRCKHTSEMATNAEIKVIAISNKEK